MRRCRWPRASGLDDRSGQTFTADSGAAFDALVALLTDGAENGVAFSTLLVGGGGATSGITEATFFAAGDIPGLAPDAAGFTITRIELEVTALTTAVPGDDPSTDGIWTTYTYSLTYRVFGRAITPSP